MNEGKNYSAALKTFGFAVLALLALSLLSGLLSGGRMGYGYNMYYGRGTGLGVGYDGVLASILVLLIKVLWFVLIVSLVIGLFVALKKYRFNFYKLDLVDSLFGKGYTCPGCGAGLAEEYKFCPRCKISLKEVCGQCSRELQAGWTCCPTCGSDNKAAG